MYSPDIAVALQNTRCPGFNAVETEYASCTPFSWVLSSVDDREYSYLSVVVEEAPRSRILPDSSMALDQPKVWVAVCEYFFDVVRVSVLVKVKVSLESVLALV